MNPRYLTKSRFKLGLECPRKLFYAGKTNEYADQKIDDPFLLALAKGGFQVGELAKCYHPEGIDVRAPRGDYDEVLRQTNELLARDNVTIFEAAVRFENYFIRVDILKKTASELEVIEVKSKLYSEGESAFFGVRGGINSNWKPYLYDIAFQKLVVQNAFPEHNVSAFLMLTDKAAKCPTVGLNQKFRVKTADDGSKYCELFGELSDEEIAPANWILRKVPVDDACDRIFAGTDTRPARGKTLDEVASEFAESYSRDERLSPMISANCKTCEFKATTEHAANGLKDGFKECWSDELGWTEDDFLVPTVLDVWNFRDKDKMILARKIRMSDLTIDDIGTKPTDKPGLSRNARQWLQVEKAVAGDTEAYFDIDGMRAEMHTWKFPLHFIDFETATPAIPFTKGRRPYEEVAFQFSHHVVHADGRVEHAGEHLDERINVFPNYAFVRMLKRELENDDGTIFRFAAHENTYLVKVFQQLMEDEDPIADRDELCAFIQTITTGSRKKFGDDEWVGPRNMVDMCELVKQYYYDPYTNGSNSIKKVLPAMLNSSGFLRQRYSQPISDCGITSRNFQGDFVWVESVDGVVRDPYEKLPRVFGSEVIERLSDETDEQLKDGGAAMIAYARLQFEDMSSVEREEIRSALKRYCELDTLAMVMIYEGWREMCR